ncbi:winged helix-turn-helix domain-containing protein [Microbulbifer harenosus]|uniref:OmpR/PhoB-type domain-containing protein n=1 Tax=Microbulbifer harenosus TaxID=2576840 RepID=A0ABY2UFE8_9GAMM|nr:winged helix-turn-helix domain-containing protein [Microbulbifer harenosus]TLM76099.1 hypothetical protein FDY93_14130 [Microbulbifer harenosus]
MQNPIYIGNWLLDVHEGTLVDGDVARRLDHTPLQLLLCLIRHAGEDVSKQQLLDEVWPRKVVTEDAISVAISQVRRALGDNARRPAYIKTLPGYGYRLIAAVAEASSPRQPRTGWHWRVPVLLSLSLLLGVTLAASWWLISGKVTSTPVPVETAGSSAPPVIAVLPIGNPGGDADSAALAEGFAEYLVAGLARHTGIRVISHTSSMVYRDTGKKLPEIAEELHASALVEGSVVRRGEQIEFSLRLIDSASDHLRWSKVLLMDKAGRNALANTAEEVATQLAAAVAGEKASLQEAGRAPYLPPEKALAHYQLGRYLLLQAEPEHGRRAVTAFEQALVAAPDFAPAYVGLAQARIRSLGDDSEVRRALPELRQLLEKALQLNPVLADAHLELANLVFLYEWDFPSAERHFKSALASNPSHGLAHFHYSQFLLAMGRFDEAMHEVRAYRTLDPFSYSVPSVAWIYNMMGAYPQALAELDKRMPLQQPSLVHLWSRQAILENMGREEESFRAYLQVLAEMDYGERELAAAERAFAESGLRGFYRWLAFEKRELRNIGQYQAPLSLARYAVAAGEQERALEWLQQALQARQLELLWVAVDPKYAPLRGRPEFTALLRQIGLPQGGSYPSNHP